MTYKQIEASRELRLWIGQVIVPTVTGAIVALQVPEVRAKADELKNRIKTKFKKNN